jgi:hypothetical protein
MAITAAAKRIMPAIIATELARSPRARRVALPILKTTTSTPQMNPAAKTADNCLIEIFSTPSLDTRPTYRMFN